MQLTTTKCSQNGGGVIFSRKQNCSVILALMRIPFFFMIFMVLVPPNHHLDNVMAVDTGVDYVGFRGMLQQAVPPLAIDVISHVVVFGLAVTNGMVSVDALSLAPQLIGSKLNLLSHGRDANASTIDKAKGKGGLLMSSFLVGGVMFGSLSSIMWQCFYLH